MIELIYLQDVDILVLNPSSTQAQLKSRLETRFPFHFYTEDSKTQPGVFRRLLYRVPRARRVIGIDLLLANEPAVEIPKGLRMSHAMLLNGLPTAPLDYLLYHKLLGWADRVHSPRRDKRVKARTKDYNDILQLCNRISEAQIRPLAKRYMGHYYQQKFKERARQFVARYYQVDKYFETIGIYV